MLGTLIGGFVFLILLAVAFGVLIFVFWILMLIDCLKRDFKKDVEKIVCVIVIIFLHIIGALIYYFVVKANEKNIKKKK